MKRTFMKFLPIAAAVLLATSCSKDEGNTVVDNVVTPDPVQEVVEQPTFKTITITGKLIQNSLSKVTTSGTNNRTLKLEDVEEFSFSQSGVKGLIKIAADGAYTADITFSDETDLLASAGFTASAGDVPDGKTAYESLTKAVEAANYTIDFQVNKKGEDSYSLSKKGDASTDINVENNSAFIYVRGAVTGDKIVFDGTNEIGTPAVGKYYIVPAGVKMGSGSNLTVAGKIYNVGKAAFSVDASNKVEFSKGNLQYDDGTWSFAEHQWDCIGNDAGNISSTGKRDLFGWGTGDDPMKTEETDDYSTFTDWASGVDIAGDGHADWRTLSSTEWDYIFNTEGRGTTRYSMAVVHGVKGVVLLPDSWNGGYTFANTNKSDAAFAAIFNDDWDILAAQGAVFLPSAGRRTNKTFGYEGYGFYWSSTASDASYANYLYFTSEVVKLDIGGVHYGRSVRLVRGL